MLTELVEHVIGVDPDRDWITVAAVDAHHRGGRDRTVPGRPNRLRGRGAVGRRPLERIRAGLGDRGDRELRTRPRERA